jgi:hypothetical protein
VLELIGNTPLLSFRRVTRHLRTVQVFGKAEWYNPGGSVKDRAAMAMVLDGERRGLLTRDKTLIDATSGNTGIAYAMIGAERGYRVKLCLPRNASPERKQNLQAYGAELVLTDPTEGTDGAQRHVKRLVDAQIEPPTFARRNFPPALESIVMRTLEKHADDRYQSAYDLADDLESFLRDEKLHSGPVRIARYLDMLAIASGGARRPELVSEAEAKRGEGADDLDFDSQVFDGFKPSEGAPGPEQAPLWEDVEQNEAEVAAALHMGLAELRSLRTPVPTRPSGMTKTPFSSRISSASAVVGPFAPSQMTFARMRAAFFVVITFSSAAGTRASTSSVSSSSFVMGVPLRYPSSAPCLRTHSAASWTSMPRRS